MADKLLSEEVSSDQMNGLQATDGFIAKPKPEGRQTDDHRLVLQKWREGGLRVFGVLCTFLFFITLIAIIVFIASYSWFEKRITWTDTDKGPLWYAVLPQITVLLGALAGGALWVINWFQKQATIDTQRDALQETQRQFEENRKKDQNQFQRRMLEERFNRILDDIAKEDPASRAGAASRLASIAKELSPEVESGAAISEDNNPFYMPAVRQLAQRLIMEENKQVGAAIQDALEEISAWTKKEAEGAINRPVARAEIDKTQAQLIHILAETNRSALAAWLDAFAGFLIAKKVFPAEGSDLKFADSLMEQISNDSSLLPSLKNRANWCYQEETYTQAIHSLIGLADFKTSYQRRREDQGASEKDSEKVKRDFALATQRLLFARDTLSIGLKHLPEPTNLPKVDEDSLERAKAFSSWKRDSALNLHDVFLQGADLEEAQMQGANLVQAQMQGANLVQAQMQGANLVQAQMQGANLVQAQMQGANLTSAQIQGAYPVLAQMQGADLKWAQMQGANLTSAQMQGAKIEGAQMQGAYLVQAQMQEAYLVRAQMQGADLKWAQMQGAYLVQAQMQGADLRSAQMQGAFVHNADLASGKRLPIDALRSEFRNSVWDRYEAKLAAPGRPLNEEEQSHYDAVVRKLIEQGDLSEEVGAKLIGKSPVGEGAVTYEMVMAEAAKATEQKPETVPEEEADIREPEPVSDEE